MSGTDTEARFVALIEQHAGLLRKVAGAYARDPEDRRDLLQDIHVQLWRAFPGYDASRRFSTWMYRVALNVAISNLRRAGPRAGRVVSLESGGPDAGPLDPVDPTAGPRPAGVEDDRARALREFIARLDPLNRAVLILYLEDASHREIAEVLGITESNVGTKIHRLKRQIREELTERR